MWDTEFDTAILFLLLQGIRFPLESLLEEYPQKSSADIFFLKAFVFKEFEALKIFLVLGGCMKL